MIGRRRTALWVAATAIGAAIIAWVVWSDPPPPYPIPPALVAELNKHRAAEARADSVIRAARIAAEAARRRQEAAESRARVAEATARELGQRADSEAARAPRARTAQDSARAWMAAYLTRTAQVDTLLQAIAGKDSALDAAADRIAALARAAEVADAGRVRADSILDALVRSVARGECRVPLTFGRVRCPTRREAVVGGAIAGAVAVRLLTRRG